MEKQYGSAKVSVWWDLEHWNDYKDFDPCQIKGNIFSALGRAGYMGSVSIFCYVVEETKIPQHVLMDLSASGISIRKYPKDEKPAVLILDMMKWANNNPPPANYLVISDDVRLTYLLYDLRRNNYNILLALSPKEGLCHSFLFQVAKSVWLSTSLLSGKSAASEQEVNQLWGPVSDSDDDTDDTI